MKFLSSNEIRKIWLSFFQKHNHLLIKSASLIPDDDKTLLWINSGVATLKKQFDGREIALNNRLVSIQKSIRTNDIENVGKTSSHNTFFEMMGNFSIGNYFRNEAIEYCFELLTSQKYFAIPIEKLYITYYFNDKETFNKWISLGIQPEHLLAKKDNFWEIGCGPCGPNTEIYFDRGIEYDPKKIGIQLLIDDIQNDRYIEIWNIVFSQFNAELGLDRNNYKELPSKNIDTGAGLERFACIFQNVATNFETDLFLPIINEISKIFAIKYNDQNKVCFRIIADHIKTCVFALSDGACFGNDGRNYVLRKLLRRAVVYAHKLGINQPFMSKLVDVVNNIYLSVYPELTEHKNQIVHLIKDEEERFFKVLHDGIKIFQKMVLNHKIDGFKLYDTFGFPIELTIELAKEHNLSVDLESFNQQMSLQKQKAKNSVKNIQSMQTQSKDLMDCTLKSNFNYQNKILRTKIIALFMNGKKVDKIAKNSCGEIIFAETNFYFLGGGQICDVGFAYNEDKSKMIYIQSVIKAPHGQGLHFFKNLGDEIKINDELILKNQNDLATRKMIECNHSTTHLLHTELKKKLNDKNIAQKGSYISDQYFHFDFNYDKKIDNNLLNEIELAVNTKIFQNITAKIQYLPIKQAKTLGAEMHFENKYSDVVRVVEIGDSKEFCCGTHVENTSQIGLFKIISKTSIASGIQRIVGCTSLIAFNKINNVLNKIECDLDTDFNNLEQKVKYLNDQNKYLNSKLKEYSLLIAKNVALDIYHHFEKIGDYKLIIKSISDVEFNLLKNIISFLKKNNNYLIVLINHSTGKAKISVLTDIKKINAREIIQEICKIAGGSGGGNLNEANGYINDVKKVDVIKENLKNKLS